MKDIFGNNTRIYHVVINSVITTGRWCCLKELQRPTPFNDLPSRNAPQSTHSYQQQLPSPLKMQLPHIVLAFTLFAFAYAVPQSPVGSSGSGDTGGTNSGDTVGSGAAASSASSGKYYLLRLSIGHDNNVTDICRVWIALTSSTSSKSSTATSSSAGTASTKSGATALLSPDWSVAGSLALVVGGAAML